MKKHPRSSDKNDSGEGDAPAHSLAEAVREGLLDLKRRTVALYEEVLPFLAPSETKFLVALAVLIGLATGLFAYAFDNLIHWTLTLCFGEGVARYAAEPFAKRWPLLLLPALGGLIVGPMLHHFAPEARGEGVPNVLRHMSQRGGKMRGRVALLKALASAVTIGTGGSAGREGPIVQIGASIGSRLAQLFRVPAVTLKTMAAAGSAAGIAAAFNAPLGGMLFSLEVILGEIVAGPFAMVVISTVVAASVSRMLHGAAPLFPVPSYGLVHWGELGLYALLGVIAGIAAKLFQRWFYFVEDRFEDFKGVPAQYRPAIGGLLTGAVGFFVPGALGTGYGVIGGMLTGDVAVQMLGLLIVAKIAATAFTLSSGGSGGTLMPALFLGAAIGSLFGHAAHALMPSLIDPGAYALVGMAAFFAGLVHAPLSAMLILFEMTGDYDIILPLMFAAVSAVMAGKVLENESIYTEKLKRIGVYFSPESETALLTKTLVSEVMTRKVSTLGGDFPIGRLGRHFNKEKRAGFPVVDEEGLLLGMITYAEAQAAYTADPPPPPDTPIRKIMRAGGKPLFADDHVSDAVRRMDSEGVDRLPVVDRDNPRKLVGIISQRDLLMLYAKRISA